MYTQRKYANVKITGFNTSVTCYVGKCIAHRYIAVDVVAVTVTGTTPPPHDTANENIQFRMQLN